MAALEQVMKRSFCALATFSVFSCCERLDLYEVINYVSALRRISEKINHDVTSAK